MEIEGIELACHASAIYHDAVCRKLFCQSHNYAAELATT